MTIPTLDDLTEVVDNPAGTPVSQKLTLDLLTVNPTWVLTRIEGAYIQADFTLSNASGVQAAFPAATDVLTLLANTSYRFRGHYIINTGATTHTTALAFALTTATVSTFEYFAYTWSAAVNTITTTTSSTHVSGVASKVINATSTAVYTLVDFEGIFRTGTAGTITPQINFSAAPGVTCLMKIGSFIEFYPLGINTLTKVGGWA